MKQLEPLIGWQICSPLNAFFLSPQHSASTYVRVSVGMLRHLPPPGVAVHFAPPPSPPWHGQTPSIPKRPGCRSQDRGQCPQRGTRVQSHLAVGPHSLSQGDSSAAGPQCLPSLQPVHLPQSEVLSLNEGVFHGTLPCTRHRCSAQGGHSHFSISIFQNIKSHGIKFS